MEIREFKEKLIQNAKMIDVELNEAQIEKLYKYMNLLIEWNQKMNLTSIVDPEEIIVKHFVDSLTIQKYIEKNASVLDVGTGAGFPGIPLKIVREDIKVTLLDSLNKRIIFLDEVIDILELKEVFAIHGRAEEMGRNKEYRERYNTVVSRAVASLSALLEYMSPFVRVGGKLICMKGPKLVEELEESGNAIKTLGLEVEKTEEIVLPNTDMQRNVLTVRKASSTVEKYPRCGTNIRKSPL